MFKQVAIPHMLYGGAAFLGYQLVQDFMTHHNETSNRPKIIDHTIAMVLIGGAAAACTGGGSLWRVWTWMFFFGTIVSPTTWWLKMQGVRPGSYTRRPANIFYENGVTKEEVERF